MIRLEKFKCLRSIAVNSERFVESKSAFLNSICVIGVLGAAISCAPVRTSRSGDDKAELDEAIRHLRYSVLLYATEWNEGLLPSFDSRKPPKWWKPARDAGFANVSFSIDAQFVGKPMPEADEDPLLFIMRGSLVKSLFGEDEMKIHWSGKAIK